MLEAKVDCSSSCADSGASEVARSDRATSSLANRLCAGKKIGRGRTVVDRVMVVIDRDFRETDADGRERVRKTTRRRENLKEGVLARLRDTWIMQTYMMKQ